MKLNSVLIAAAIISMSAGAANANLLYDFYASGAVGVGGAALFDGDDTKTHNAQSYAAALGIDIPLLRLEAEYNYLHTKSSTLQIAMANAQVKFLPGLLQPYVGAGVGMIIDGDAYDVDAKNTAAYQGMLGLTVNPPVLPLAFDLEARVLYVPDIVKVDDHKPDVLQYEGRIKLRYIF